MHGLTVHDETERNVRTRRKLLQSASITTRPRTKKMGTFRQPAATGPSFAGRRYRRYSLAKVTITLVN